jgi:hypothetical protein
MAIVHDDVWLLLLVVHYVHASEVGPLDLCPADGARDEAVPQHAEAEKWQRHSFRKESSPDKGGHVGKGEANEADDEILKWRCFLDERCALSMWGIVSFANELVWYFENFDGCKNEHPLMIQRRDTY